MHKTLQRTKKNITQSPPKTHSQSTKNPVIESKVTEVDGLSENLVSLKVQKN